jgi:predicted phage terminase large subunit-like protein
MPAPNAINPRTGKRYGWEAAQAAKPRDDTGDIRKQLALLKRQKKAVEARDDLIKFVEFTMPDPEDPNDVERSRYKPTYFHRAIARHLEQMERGEFRQLIFCMPPRHGKTELATKRFVAWFMGRNPFENVAVGTYSDTMAEDYGADVRNIMASAAYKQVFPAFGLMRGGAAKANIQTTKGGRAVFVGTGGALTGRGASLLIIDDPIKGAEEARSQAMRDQAWEWFTKVAMTRLMRKKIVIIITTRWHSDDIVGRLTDKENPKWNAEESATWKIINIPAIAEEDDVLGRKPGEVLWPDGPDEFDLAFMKQKQRLDPLGFAALYQQRPTVADGVLFRRENIQFYKQADLPEDLRIYCSSDHAVGTKQRNDYTVMFKVGIDRQSNIWVLDCFRAKVASDKAVEAMLAMASGTQKPLLWWAERGHISKSIGPFLRKRMLETKTYINMVEVTPVADKEQRAQSIAARVAMGKVYFPLDKLWTEKVVNEMLAFPNGTNDDAVDALAYIGLGLQNQFGPSKHSIAAKQRAEQPATLTLDWVKLSARHEAEKQAQRRLGGC